MIRRLEAVSISRTLAEFLNPPPHTLLASSGFLWRRNPALHFLIGPFAQNAQSLVAISFRDLPSHSQQPAGPSEKRRIRDRNLPSPWTLHGGNPLPTHFWSFSPKSLRPPRGTGI